MRGSVFSYSAPDGDMSALDPGYGLSALFLTDEPLPRGSAENAILSWLISLPVGTDPARAAATLGMQAPFADAEAGEAGRASALLKEIAQYPAERLPQVRRRRVRN